MADRKKSFKEHMLEGGILGGVSTLAGYPFKVTTDPLSSGAYKGKMGKDYLKYVARKMRAPRSLAVLPIDMLKNSLTLGLGWAVGQKVVPKLVNHDKKASYSLTKLGFKCQKI